VIEPLIVKTKQGSAPNFQSLNCYKSADDRSISQKIGREFDQMIIDTSQSFIVLGSYVKVTA